MFVFLSDMSFRVDDLRGFMPADKRADNKKTFIVLAQVPGKPETSGVYTAESYDEVKEAVKKAVKSMGFNT